MSSVVGEAFVRLRPEDSGFEREAVVLLRRDVERVERTLGRSADSADRFARGVLAGSGALGQLSRLAAFTSTSFLGGAGLVYGLKVSKDAASSLNEQISRSQVVFGRAQPSIQAFADTATTQLGLASDQAIEAASVFGTLFANIGTAPEQAAALSEELVRLGSDLASFADTNVVDALAAIRSGLTGEIEPLRRYGAFLSEAATQQEAFRVTGKKSADQLTTQDRVLARYRLLLEQTTLAQGDFARTSDSLANQERTLAANLREVEIAIGRGLNPTLEELLPKINEYLGDSEKQEAITRKVAGAMEFLTEAGGDLVDVIQTINEVTEPAVEAIGGLDNAIQALLIALALAKITRFVGVLRSVEPAGKAAALGIAATGSAAAVADAQVFSLGGRLATLAKIAVPAIAIPIVFDLSQQARAAGQTNPNILGDKGSVQRFVNDLPIVGDINLALEQTAQAIGDALGFDVFKSGPTPVIQTLKRQLDQLEALRAAAGTTFTPQPAGTAGRGSVGDRLAVELSAARQRELRLAQVAGTGTPQEVALLNETIAADKRAIAFAEERIRTRQGNTRAFADQLERLYADLRANENRLAAIAAEGEQRVLDAQQAAAEARRKGFERIVRQREKAREDAVQAIRQIGEAGLRTGGGPLAVVRGFVLPEDQVERFEERLQALTRPSSLLSLQTQIAEQRFTDERKLIPFLDREQRNLERRLRILKRSGGTQEEILQATLNLEQLRRRERDIRNRSRERPRDGFTLSELFAQAAEEIQFASNIGGGPLSRQDARQAFAGAVLNRAGDRTIVVNQHFNGPMPQPGLALQQASQAARALR